MLLPPARSPRSAGSSAPRSAGALVVFALVLGALGSGSVGCAASQKQVKTPRYVLSHPDYWEVKSVGMKDGEATTVIIKNYGSAIIDEGSGALDERQQNYEAVQADVEVRIYSWPEQAGAAGVTASDAAAQLLQNEGTLELGRHLRVPEQPPECGTLKKKYTIVGAKEEPYDVVSRPGWRTILLGGKKQGVLLGVVARVPYEQDIGRYCHNLSNMQVQLQNLLDGLVLATGAPSTGPPAPAAAPLPTPPAPPTS
jgi:hypothetical protein